ncbi:MAG: NHLP bacteriocin system secretion protein [Leptolyngbyaceae cyanobacterium bins.349]|nr:NHLP bacteriocin system secretion protein [Leptolyngbyaceae cyanobacterium bins.349]
MTLSSSENPDASVESFDYEASPEQLDQLMQVVKPKNWIPAVTIGGLTIATLIWSVVGRIPMTVTGQGVLISQQRVVELQSPISGQLEVLKVKDGQTVKKGEVLAAVKPLELEEQFKQLQAKRQQLLGQATNTESIQQQRTEVERQAIAATRVSLIQRLETAQSLSPTLREQSLTTIKQQRQSLQRRIQDAQAMLPMLKDRWDRRARLAKEGALEQDSLVTAEREYRQESQNIQELEAQLRQLDVNATEAQQRYIQSQNSISEIQAQLDELNTRSKRLDQENVQSSNTRRNEIAEVDRAIAQLKQQIEEKSIIRSPQDGSILDMSGVLGQVVNSGTRLGTLQTGSSQPVVLTGITYFEVKDGKQIKPGMKVQLTPDTVKRERFGGIVGTVKSVSPYPVTSSRATVKLGNSELAETLTGKAAKVEVVVELQPEQDNVSGYKWSSSKGPSSKLTPGTTASIRVTVEERAPITFLLPFLREWSGLQ